MVGLLLLPGCGGSETPQSSGDAPGGEVAPVTATQASGGGATAGESVVRVDAGGRKWIGQVPLDVWWPDPFKIAAENQPVASTGMAAPQAVSAVQQLPTAATATPAQPASPAAAPSAAGAADWNDLIAPELVDLEVKKIVNRLNEKLQTVGTYNSSHLELPPHISTLAMMAEVAAEHPGEIRWKDKARYIRDLAGKMAQENLQQGARSHKALQEPFEQIAVLMSGSEPAGLPESAGQRPFSEVSKFNYLMKRMEIGSNYLKVNVTSDETLSSNKEDVLREAGVLAVMGKVIASKGFDYEDFEDFVGFARDLSEGSRQITAAAHAGSFAEYDKGITRVYKACQECHAAYR